MISGPILRRLRRWFLGQVPAAVLVDAFVPGQHGGTGQTVPWNLLADFQPGVPLLLFIANAREAAARCG